MEMNICLDAEMKKMGFRTMLPWKSVAMTLQEEVRLRVRGLSQGRWENTKWKKIWVDILISQEGERRQIHFCFSSAVTVWETKTQVRPVGLISRGKCCLLPHCFPQKTNGDVTVAVLLVCVIRKPTSLQSSDFPWSRVKCWTFRASLSAH